jgi:hypothetical protein
MATNTYTALFTNTLGTAAPSVTFSSIPSGYTDLVLIISGTVSSEGAVRFQCNGDTSTNYSTTLLFGNGSSAVSGKASNQNFGAVGRIGTVMSNSIIHFMNYSNTTTFKTVLSRGNTSNLFITAQTTLWRATPAAITSIVLTPENATNFDAGSTFSLYGISTVGDASPKATGGDVYSDASYWYHAFPMSANFIPNQSITADVLVIAGGGGTGFATGGGGAGGVIYATSQSLTAQNYAVTIGGGGANSGTSGIKGNNSVFGSLITANGGGAGNRTGGSVANGGSGGGVATGNSPGTASAGSGGTGYANAGATGASGYGGGGGAGAAGGTNTGGNGLNTWSSWATATGTGVGGYYAGGGGGASNPTAGSNAGGLGGGGASGNSPSGATGGAGVAGAVSTGSGAGGGGVSTSDGPGASGGSGIVIVRYAK